MAHGKDITNLKVGWLTVIRPLEERGPRGDVYWLVRCRCGREIKRYTSSLLKKPRRANQSPRSCGCNKTRNRVYTSKYGCAGDLSGHRFGCLTTQAWHRGHVFTVTIEELWDIFVAQKKRCALTDIALAITKKVLRAGETIASLDRIESDVGYVTGNVQWVHPTINFMKHAMPQENFVEWCCLVAQNRKGGLH